MGDESNGEYEIVGNEDKSSAALAPPTASAPPTTTAAPNPFMGPSLTSGLPPPSAFQLPSAPPKLDTTPPRTAPPKNDSAAVDLVIPKPQPPPPVPPMQLPAQMMKTLSSAPPPATTASVPKDTSPSTVPAQQNTPPSTAPTAQKNAPPSTAQVLPNPATKVAKEPPPDVHIEEDASWTGWLRDTVQASPLLNMAAHTARRGVDMAIVTLDPQMKEYIGSKEAPFRDANGQIELAVASDAQSKIMGVREGFAHSFAHVNARGLGAPGASTSEKIAHQPRGADNGLIAANERVRLLRESNLVNDETVVVAVEGFVQEMHSTCWCDLACVVLDDRKNDIRIVQYGQPTILPEECIRYIQSHTPSDYPRLKYGYAVTCGDAVAHISHARIDPKQWHECETGIERRQLIEKAVQALAYRYKNALFKKAQQ